MGSGDASEPRASILISAFNAGRFLRASVMSAVAQTYRNLEIRVIDDGSTDGSLNTISDIRDPRLRIIRQDNCGKPVALNRALDEIDSDFYAVQDADDLSHPHRIESQVQCLIENPELGGCFSGYDLIVNERRVAPLARPKHVAQCARDIAELAMPAHDPTGMYRMSLVGDLRYEPSLPIAEGHDYILRVGERHPLQVVGRCLYSYRIHADSLTHRDPQRRQAAVREVLLRACKRRGLDPGEILEPVKRGPGGSGNSLADNNIAAHLMESAIDQRGSGKFWGAVSTGLFSAALHPFDTHYYKPLAYSLVPPAFVSRLRGRARG